MKFFGDMKAFFRFLRAVFIKWFLPLPYGDADNDEDEWDDEKKKAKPKKAKPAVKGASDAADAAEEDAGAGFDDEPHEEHDGYTETPKEPEDVYGLRRDVIAMLALCNIRRINHVARACGVREEQCRTAIEGLATDGIVFAHKRKGWYGLCSEHRQNYLETNEKMDAPLALLNDDGFRAVVIGVLSHLLESFPLSLKPAKREVGLLLKNRRAARLLCDDGSITVELTGAFDGQIFNQIERCGGDNIVCTEELVTFEWRPNAQSSNIFSLLRDALERRKKELSSKPRKKTRKVKVAKPERRAKPSRPPRRAPQQRKPRKGNNA